MSRRSSRLLDRGTEQMLVFPSAEQLDRQGNRVRVADMDAAPISLLVNVSTDRQATAELPGQVDVMVLKVSTREFPLDSYDRIELRGQEWDLAVPPVFSRWTRSTSHVALILRSRNRAAS